MEHRTFHFYPTILNEFARFEQNKISEQTLVARINRIPETDPGLLQKFQLGVSFEDAVLKNKPSNFSSSLIEECQQKLPKQFNSQQKLSFVFQNIQFYGFADITGEKRVIDLKSTAIFKPEKYRDNYQNLYLYALKDMGFVQMEYIVCDGKKVFHEIYPFQEIDFTRYLGGMERFRQFILNHLTSIKDKKIVRPRQADLFS